MMAKLIVVIFITSYSHVMVDATSSSAFNRGPTAPPSGFRLYSVDLTSITVKWGRIPPDQRNGQITKYFVKYQRVDGRDGEFITTINEETYKATLIALEADTDYCIKVAGATSQGTGVYSSCLEVRTNKQSPSRAPDVIIAYNSSSTSLVITWSHVSKQHFNGKPIGYNISYYPVGLEMNESVITVNYTNTTELKNLNAFTVYVINVSAVSSGGVGPGKTTNASTDDTACFSSPCLNGGTCSPHGVENSFYCTCSYLFTGIRCASLVNDPTCHSPNVSLPNLSPDSGSSAVSIRRSNSFLIQSDIILDCALSQKTTFTWSIYNYNLEMKAEDQAPCLSTNGSSEFRIMPHMLSIGDYSVRLTVNMLGTQVSGVGQGFIKVTRSPLVALIAGGTKVVRGFNRSLVFDASMSYDPDEENQESSSLNFTWLCTNSSNLGGCYRNGDKIESNGSVLTVNSGLMLENNSYFINVKITKDQRQAEYTQEVFIVPGNPPEVQIRCVDNCNVKLNPSGRMALQGICPGSSCGGTLTYHWSLFNAINSSSSNKTQWLEIPGIQQLISTRVTSTTLVTYPGVLEPDMLYKFVLTAKRPGGYLGYSEYQVTTNSPPMGGYCQVSPESGVTLDTEFTFICGNWQDEDLPLQYEFIYFTKNDLLNVVYKGGQTSKHTKLPVGDKLNNFTIDFRVRVADMFGAFTEVNNPVQVVEPNIEATNLVDIAANLTTGDNSELSKLIQSGDLSRAVQLATAAIVAVDDTAHAHAASQEELTTKRIAVFVMIITISLSDQSTSRRLSTSTVDLLNQAHML